LIIFGVYSSPALALIQPSSDALIKLLVGGQ
jgi:hypothetical protein